MKILTLAASSSGNSTFIQSHDGKASILIDAGITLKEINKKVGQYKIDATFLTHDHSDHIKSIGPLGRKRKKMPIYMHEWIFNKHQSKFKNCKIEFMNPGDTVTINNTLEIKNFSTKHDATYTYGFIIKDLSVNKTLCYLTDTGTITGLMRAHMKDADVYFIEADYDEELLRDYEEYDDFLKERISSDYGHLGNRQTLDALEAMGIDKASHIIFTHLSVRTNTPEKVLELAIQRFPNYSGKMLVAPVTDFIDISETI